MVSESNKCVSVAAAHASRKITPRRAERNHLGTYEQAAEVTRRNCSCSVFLSNFGGIMVEEKEGHAVVHQSAVNYVMHMGSQWVG